MTDTTTTEQGQDADRPAVDVAEAARILGITHDAVRARIRRGSLDAVKDGTTWRVILPDDAHDAGQDTDTTATGADTTPPAALITQLQSEVDYLRSELTAARIQAAKERERADVLQREALQRIEALTAGTITASEAPGSPESVDTVAHGSGVGQGDTTGTGTQHDATGGFLGWLRRLISG